jgi:hypothetical protein
MKMIMKMIRISNRIITMMTLNSNKMMMKNITMMYMKMMMKKTMIMIIKMMQKVMEMIIFIHRVRNNLMRVK